MNGKSRKVHIALFLAYCALMLWLLFDRSGAIDGVPYWEQVRMSLNLRPFHTITKYIRLLSSSRTYLVRLSVINLFGNVVMFLPLGLFLPLLWEKFRKLRNVLLATALIITAVELIQLLTLVGSCDIDDLILNVIGSAMGYGLYILFRQKN